MQPAREAFACCSKYGKQELSPKRRCVLFHTCLQSPYFLVFPRPDPSQSAARPLQSRVCATNFSDIYASEKVLGPFCVQGLFSSLVTSARWLQAKCKMQLGFNTHIFHPLSGVCNDVERKESLECKSSTSAALLNLSCCKLCLRVKFSLLVTRVNELQIRLRGIFICLSKSLLKAFSLFCWCFYVFLPHHQI